MNILKYTDFCEISFDLNSLGICEIGLNLKSNVFYIGTLTYLS
jgi:hypothetical protein